MKCSGCILKRKPGDHSKEADGMPSKEENWLKLDEYDIVIVTVHFVRGSHEYIEVLKKLTSK